MSVILITIRYPSKGGCKSGRSLHSSGRPPQLGYGVLQRGRRRHAWPRLCFTACGTCVPAAT